ncbi:MAG TPA: sulfite exporter TauE/SafE family protein [Arenimonas sp.]|uniref:sulfite exporter TauE/SafE family protein n=1 Tax=Arenimonas sp. TaxID=1872635 RepID=UPI002D7E6829|nr:sulfite exporter TauE/SafE family protein [Arenimonas sp.]HEU0153052.1 sulfite exporter TauE/SafE family protein [Arenimonas sp.]
MPVDLTVLAAALLTGLLGGLHCAAMCGGIATGLAASLPKPGLGPAFALNGGRLLGYTLAGALVGGFGGGLLTLARFDGLATSLRVAMGGVLLVAALRLVWPAKLGFVARGGQWFWRMLRPLQARVVPAAGPMRPWVLGLFWGWLPCGLSTTMLAAAWLEASALHGALLMLAFGTGTLATMLPITWTGGRLGGLLQHRRWRLAGAIVIALAGAITMAGPWLARQPAIHDVLVALGCRSL